MTDSRLIRPAQVIDGISSAPEDGADEVTTPANGVTTAIAAAWRDHRAAPAGIGTADQRVAALELAAKRVDEISDAIAVQDSLNSGVPITIARLFAGSLAGTFRAAADRVSSLDGEDLSDGSRTVRLYQLPLGPAAVLAPWNAPTAVAAKKAAYAWAAGCPVIIKPSPWSPNGTTLLVAVMHEAAREVGLPSAAIQLVFGGAATGQLLASAHAIRAISFTGSRSGGRAVAATASATLAAVQLELGSNNPVLVLADADVGATAASLAAGMAKLNGAWCESPGTVFVPSALRDDLVRELVARLSELTIGEPLDEHATFGPQANSAQYENVRRRIDAFAAGGAEIVSVGAAPRPWIVPTLVIDPPAELARDETFGPVLVIRTADDVDQAIDESFRLSTGLAGYVFTRDRSEGQRIGVRLPAGEVKINGTSLLDMSDRSAQAFWYGSGVGGHGDAELLRFFTGARIVGDDVDSPL